MKPKHPKLRWHDWKNGYLPLYPEAHRREIFSLDSCISQFLVPRLKLMRKEPQGYPSGISMNRWLAILDEMIYGFEFAGDDHFFEDDNLYKRINRESKGRLWDHPEVQASLKRAEKGRRLFAKWYGSLWT